MGGLENTNLDEQKKAATLKLDLDTYRNVCTTLIEQEGITPANQSEAREINSQIDFNISQLKYKSPAEQVESMKAALLEVEKKIVLSAYQEFPTAVGKIFKDQQA